MSGAGHERPLGTLLADLSRDVAALVRDEIALARAEVRAKIRTAVRHVALVAAAAAIAGLGAVTLVAGAVLVLVRLGMPGWGAALLVGVTLAATAALLAARGLSALRASELAPTLTIQTLREMAEWPSRAR